MDTLLEALTAPLLSTGLTLERVALAAREIAAGLEGLAKEADAPFDATVLVRRQRGPHVAPVAERRTSPTVVCTVCGKTLSVGDERVSHGLCDECFADFMQDRQ
jgi:hypothetical protein